MFKNNFNESVNFKDNFEKSVKSSALRNLLNEIRSENTSPSSSVSPLKLQYYSKASTLAESQGLSNNFNKIKESKNIVKDVNFGDMKSDIQALQDKILNLEKRLCIFSIILVNKPTKDHNRDDPDNDSKYTANMDITQDKAVKLKNSESNSCLKTIKSLDNFKVKIKSQSSSLIKSQQKASLGKIQMQMQNDLFKSFVQKRESENAKSNPKLNQNNSFLSETRNNSLNRNTRDIEKYSYKNTVKEWKERYYKALKEHEITKGLLIKEKQKNIDIIKHNKNLERKSTNFDNLNQRLNKVIDDHEKLLNQFEQSEIIRREQSKLIKTLQNEITVLRKNDTSKNILGNLDISQESLTESKNFKQSLPFYKSSQK